MDPHEDRPAAPADFSTVEISDRFPGGLLKGKPKAVPAIDLRARVPDDQGPNAHCCMYA